MKYKIFFLFLAVISPLFAQSIKWIDAKDLGVDGRGFQLTESYYDRLPAAAKNIVYKDIWRLSKHSAGMYVRFYSTSDTIHIKWSLTSPSLSLFHMPSTGVSGIDLYKYVNGVFKFVDNARPSKQENNTYRFSDYETASKGNFYLLYLPLYNGITDLKIGVPENEIIKKDTSFINSLNKPVVFYGTSIMQGGVASRPGMCFTAILQRRLNLPLVNLGFSGNGKMEPEMMSFIASVDASLYVIDCHRNMSIDEVKLNTEPGIRLLKKLHPDTPILLVEESNFKEKFPTDRGIIMKGIYNKLISEGFTGIYYLEGNNMLGDDYDGTVDGVHPNDYGFEKFADCYEPVLRQILNLK